MSTTIGCKYENQTKVYKQLIDGGFVTFSQPYMTKLVKQGKIPFKDVNGKKHYCLKEVIESLGLAKERKAKSNTDANQSYSENIRTLDEELKYQQARVLRQKADSFDELSIFRDEAENTIYTLFQTVKKQFQMLTTRVPMSRELKDELDNEIESILKDLSNPEAYLGH